MLPERLLLRLTLGVTHTACAVWQAGPMTASTDPVAIMPRVDPAADVRRSVPLIINGALYLRIFAAASIVWFHTPGVPLREVGGIGLAIFIYLSFVHVGRVHNMRIMFGRRARQLLVPWACWWLVYAAAKCWMARGIPSEVASFESIWTILAWPSIHLWFLPFLFFAHLGVSVVRAAVAFVRAPVKLVITLSVALVLLAGVAITPRFPSVVEQVWRATPAIGIGLVYGYSLTLDRPKRLPAFVIVAVLVTLACLPVWLWGDRVIAVAAIGGSLLMILLPIHLPRHRQAIRLARLTLGIYLSHPMVMELLWKVFGNSLPPWILALATWVLATAVAWAMFRNRFLRIAV